MINPKKINRPTNATPMFVDIVIALLELLNIGRQMQ
jgi:hypothetical protein